MLKILNNDKFTTAQNRHSLVSLKIPILNTLPFRALLFALCSFIMCACFATFYLAQNRAEIFLYFEHPTREGNKMFVAFLFMPRGKMLSGGRHRLMFYPPQPPDDERKPTMPLFLCQSEGCVCSFLSSLIVF